jgi:N6-L-threonylcarbamoyladenine synthase
LRWIVPTLDEAWEGAGVSWDDIDGVAVTYGPGLAGSLLVGINFAKALAWVHDKPLVGVNHLEGHVYAAWLHDSADDDRPDPVFPLVALVVSGGHTFLAEMRDHLTYRLLGTTLDDAAGEAFDKVGRLLGLGYPGGPAIGRAAEAATRHDRVFPRAWLGDSYDLSFSGLKTAARRIITEAKATPQRVWLGEVSAVVLQQALADLNTAYRNFFNSISGKRQGPQGGLAPVPLAQGQPAGDPVHSQRQVQGAGQRSAEVAEDR